MNWSSWSEFFAMGGYGVYVWGSYVVTLVCVIGELILISRRRRTLEKTYGLNHDSYTDGISNNSNDEAVLDKRTASDNQEKKEISDMKSITNKEEIKNETTS